MKNKFTTLLILLLPLFSMAQNVVISGTVIRSENNEPMIGATVSIKGTTRGTITDIKGSFSLRSPKNVDEIVVVAKFIGLKDAEQTVILNGVNQKIEFKMISNESQLQDVVVTANKSEEFLQKVGTAATVVSSRDIEQRTSYTTLEALKDAPLLISDSWITSHTTFSLRGLSNSIDNVGFENTVGLYLDDVYYSRPFIFNAALFDIDRIEILRGPQGTLFGKNTVGGVIHIISEKPEHENNGQAEISVGNFGYKQFRGKWNQVLIKDKLSVRLTGAFNNRNGYIKDLNPLANEFNKTTFMGLRGSVFYTPNKNLDIIGKFYIGEDRNAEQTLTYASKTEFDDPDLEKRIGIDPLGVKATDRNTTETNVPQEFHRDQIGSVLKINYRLGENTLTSISAYNFSDDNVFRDFDASKVDAMRWGRDQELRTLSQEFRITSPRDKKFAYVAGIYLLSEHVASNDVGILKSGILKLASRYLGRNFNVIPSSYEESYISDGHIDNTNYAFYGSSSYMISPRTKLNVGLRFTSENREFGFFQKVNYFNQNGFPVNIVGIFANPIASEDAPFTKSAKDNVLTYDLGLDYKLNNYMMSYAKVVRGFKGTGFNTSATRDISGLNLTYKPEFVNNFELGLKSKFDNRNLLNAAVYYTSYENKQESIDLGGAGFVLANAARTGGWGAEVEYSTMFDRLRVDISGGLLDIRYKDFVAERDEDGDIVTDFSGNRLVKAPNVTLSVSPQYSFDFRDKYRIILGGNINYIGSSYNDIHNEEFLKRKPVTMVNTRLSLMPRSGKWSFALWGKNLLNESYIQHGWENIFGNVVSLNRPTTFGVESYLNFK